MIIDELQKKSNNLLQSKEWASFQEATGKALVEIGGWQALKVPLYFGKSFLWVQRGPATLSEFKKPAVDKDVLFLRLEPFVAPKAEIKKKGLKEVQRKRLLGGQKSPKATRVMDISGSEEELLAQMKPKTRYNIRLAGKKGVMVESGASLIEAEAFFQMLEKTAGRNKGYHHFEKDYYQKMIETLGPKDMVRVFLAKHEGKIVAATLVAFYGDVATYLHGGFDPEERNLMAPFLLQWSAIQEAKARGLHYYDFWGVAETDDPKDPWAGISTFKEGFGGEKVILPGAFDLILSPFWYNFFTFLAKLRKLVRR